VRCIPTLAQASYLQIDSYFEIPIQMLDEATDDLGKPLIIWAKHQGGLGELRDHVQHRDLIRGKEKLYRTTEKQSEGKDGI
jgi:hypothetical protein